VSPGYSYRSSVKSDASDELINTYLLRPAAGLLVRVVYRTPVTPNQVTLSAIVAGAVAAFLYAQGDPVRTAAAGLCLTLKDLLDSADGQLARAQGRFSRAGRFLDSIGDIAVNCAVFAAIAAAMARHGAGAGTLAACVAGFFGISLRVSYHVFYQTSFLHMKNTYLGNRTTEEMRAEDRAADWWTRTLQRVFLLLYGWQDAWIARLDAWSRRGLAEGAETDRLWYGDLPAVRLSGFLGLGTELFLLMVFSVIDRLDLYLGLNVLVMNGWWGVNVAYRRGLLRRRVGRRV